MKQTAGFKAVYKAAALIHLQIKVHVKAKLLLFQK